MNEWRNCTHDRIEGVTGVSLTCLDCGLAGAALRMALGMVNHLAFCTGCAQRDMEIKLLNEALTRARDDAARRREPKTGKWFVAPQQHGMVNHGEYSECQCCGRRSYT